MWYYEYPPTEDVSFMPYFLHSIGLHELQPPLARPLGHEYDQFFYNSNGSGTLIMNGIGYDLPEGSAFFIPAGVPHEYYPSGDIWDLRWMLPRGDGLPAMYRKLGLENGGVYKLADYRPLDIIINKMHNEIIADNHNGNLFASAYVVEFIMEFARQTGNISTEHNSVADYSDKDTYLKYTDILRDYIKYHFMHNITLNELCHLIDVTPQHLCRIFKQCTGMRPVEYITHIRLDYAKNLLANTKHSISDISVWCGFENQNYFWRIFKKNVNMTPGEYRKNNSFFYS